MDVLPIAGASGYRFALGGFPTPPAAFMVRLFIDSSCTGPAGRQRRPSFGGFLERLIEFADRVGRNFVQIPNFPGRGR